MLLLNITYVNTLGFFVIKLNIFGFLVFCHTKNDFTIFTTLRKHFQ